MSDGTPRNSGSIEVPITRINGEDPSVGRDELAIEEPLEIRLAFGPLAARIIKPISITMRTPGTSGEDFELALGFLFTEGIIHSPADVERYFYCGPETAGQFRLHNVVRIELQPEVSIDISRLERHFYTTSSCGVCGKTSIDALRTVCRDPRINEVAVPTDIIHSLPEFLRYAQSIFDRTGGLHAAALFDVHGKVAVIREDVGRHNAVDKLIGNQFMQGVLPLGDKILFLSGRASFELIQKAVMAGIPIVAAVGAPSSLAFQLAKEFNVTLLGFVRNNRFNIYTGEQRIISAATTTAK